jgi:hypothetical protein
MALRPYKFKGVSNWREDSFNDNLKYGVIAWARWAMLEIGGFENVLASQASGLYGGHPSILRPASDPNFEDGQIWEAIRSDWVWETGVSYSELPIRCSGVYVDDVFYSVSSTGEYSHNVDFRSGRIVFDSAIPISSDVRSDFSFRIPTIGDSKYPWIQELLYDSLDVSRNDFYSSTSGGYSQLPECRRQMPTIGVSLSDRRRSKPYQLGGGQWIYQDIYFHVLAEKKEDRDRLLDILDNQNDIVIYLPDLKEIKESDRFPVDLDIDGTLVDSPLQYLEMVGESGLFQWTTISLIDIESQKLDNKNDWLYTGFVKATCEAIILNI